MTPRLTPTFLRFTLRSAATFARSDGVSGLVDREVEHDEYGLPYLRGKTLKGLLAEECESLVFVLGHIDTNQAKDWTARKIRLFGVGGAGRDTHGNMHVGDARLPEAVRAWVRAGLDDKSNPLTPYDVLNSVTGIRRQSAMNEYGAPQRKALRSMRVIVKSIVFESVLTFEQPLEPLDWALLAATVMALRRAGTARNRGRGWLCAELNDAETTRQHFNAFANNVKTIAVGMEVSA